MNLTHLVQAAANVPRSAQPWGTFARVVHAGQTVGFDVRTRRATTTYTVITDAQDDLITAFPGLP